MSPRNLSLLAAMLLLAYANHTLADSDPGPRAVANVSVKGLDQIVYKGLVGNALDGIPMDPSKRVSLQRTNAIVSNAWSGHTLTALAGLSNPVLLIGGLVWGVWAASNIKPEEDAMKATSDPAFPIATPGMVALLDHPQASDATHAAIHQVDTASAKRAAAGEPNDSSPARSSVVRIWLPQRSPANTVAR